MAKKLSHYDRSGRARMVDVSGKSVTKREAEASAFVSLRPEVLGALPQVSTITTYMVMESPKDERA